jgi:hypothetical protein
MKTKITKLIRIILIAFIRIVWTPIFYIIWTPLYCFIMVACLLATLFLPGKWENGKWTRIYQNTNI